MEEAVREKLTRILKGELKYTSSNRALNNLISDIQGRIKEDPGCLGSCMGEMDDFFTRYPIVAKVDLANIAVL